MILVDRTYAGIAVHPPPQWTDEEFATPRPLAAYDAFSTLVVLGEPGAGKTTAFERAARDASDSMFVNLRRFLRAANIDQFRSRTLYIDALDETRSQIREDKAGIDGMIARLEQLDKPRFRLSCRHLDWYGSTDLHHLVDASADGQIAVVALQPLTDEDILAIVGDEPFDAAEFLHRARRFGVIDLMRNPESLRLMLEVLSDGGNVAWPTTREELYRRAALKQLEEARPEHRRTDRGKYAAEELIDPAGRLCAIALCSNIAGFAMQADVVDDSYPLLRPLAPDPKSEAASHRRLFGIEEDDRIRLPHRTMAEYLAARHLIHRVRDGLPLTRALALVTSMGGTIANLRGIYAWLTTLAGPDAAQLMRIDPMAVIRQGDPSKLPLPARRELIDLLGRIGEERGWTLREEWDDEAFGALGTRDMQPILHQVLSDAGAPPYALICVLEAIAHGPERLPDLERLLQQKLWDAEIHHFGGRVIDAYRRVAADPNPEFRRLLDAVNEGSIPDPDRLLRGRLLRLLYPKAVEPHELDRYLVAGTDTYIGPYETFLQEVAERTPVAALPDLMAALDRWQLPAKERRRHRFQHLFGQALLKALVHHGEGAKPADLLAWLKINHDERGLPILREDPMRLIGQWFEEHPELTAGVLDEWLCQERQAPSYKQLVLRRFWLMICTDPSRIPNFATILLDRAAVESDPTLARQIFVEAARLRTVHNRNDAPTLEGLLDFVTSHPRFYHDLVPSSTDNEALTYVIIPDWREEDARRRLEETRRDAAVRNENLKRLPPLEKVTSGLALNALYWAGEIYCTRRDDHEDPEVLISAHSSAAFANAALQGFISTLRSEDVITPCQIGKHYADKKILRIGYAVLAGLDCLYRANEDDVLDLPEDVLAAALCYRHTNFIYPEPRWPEKVALAKPHLAARAMLEFWRPLLEAGHEELSGLYALEHADAWNAAAQRLAIPLLQAAADPSEKLLRQLLVIALRFEPGGQLLAEVRARHRGATGLSRVFLAAAGAILDHEAWGQTLVDDVGGDASAAAAALQLAEDVMRPKRGPAVQVSLGCIVAFLEIGCATIPPTLTEHGFYDDRSRLVRNFIDLAAVDTNREVGEVLRRRYSDEGSAGWRQELLRALDAHLKRRREAEFEWPTPDRAMQTLDACGPANHEDLVALAEAELRRLNTDLRDTPTTPLYRFWNLALSAGEKPRPRPENDCRDHLIDLLQERLRPFGILIDTEARYAGDGRGDAKLVAREMTLPLEAKRHYNRELWGAPGSQLLARYARDPTAGGRGLYVVFWFGTAPGRYVPKPPAGIKRPSTAAELEDAVRASLTEQQRAVVRVICLDVSMPGSKEVRGTGGGAVKANVPGSARRSSKPAKSSPRSRPG